MADRHPAFCNLPKKGCKLPADVRAKMKENWHSKSPARVAALEKMLADPDRVKKILKTTKPRRDKARKEKLAQKKKRLKNTRAPLGRLIAVDGRSKPRYYALWVSPVEPEYRLSVATLKVIKYGRPRDPWGNFMRPVHPEYIFGLPLRNGDQLVQPPHKTNPVQNGVPEHPGSSGVDGATQPTGADGPGSVGPDNPLPRGLYRKYSRGFT
jgi:hypothetical protein